MTFFIKLIYIYISLERQKRILKLLLFYILYNGQFDIIHGVVQFIAKLVKYIHVKTLFRYNCRILLTLDVYLFLDNNGNISPIFGGQFFIYKYVKKK